MNFICLFIFYELKIFPSIILFDKFSSFDKVVFPNKFDFVRITRRYLKLLLKKIQRCVCLFDINFDREQAWRAVFNKTVRLNK